MLRNVVGVPYKRPGGNSLWLLVVLVVIRVVIARYWDDGWRSFCAEG